MKSSLLLLAWSLPTAMALSQTPSYIFTGSGLPEGQGWTLYQANVGGSSPPVITSQNSGDLSDVLSVQTFGSQIHLYTYNTGTEPYIEFLATVRVRIDSAEHNFADGGFYFSGFGLPSDPDRGNGIYLTPGEVGFMVGLGGMDSAPVTPDEFHEYALLLRGGHISVFVDDPLDDILNGTAIPELHRASATAYCAGWVFFGDQTNDQNVNSKYAVDDVRFLGITVGEPVITPEPSSAALLLSGAGLLLSRRRSYLIKRDS